MNECESNSVCCGKQQVTLDQLRACAPEVTTPNVTVSLDEYKAVLDGFSAHEKIAMRQKHAIEQQLVNSRLLAVDTLELAEQRIRELGNVIESQRSLEALRELGRECLVAQINRSEARIAELEKALRKAKRGK